MTNTRTVRLAAAILVMTTLNSCTNPRDKRIFDDLSVVARHFHTSEDGSFKFDAGPYQGGTAFVDSAGAAFWVKNGNGYVVNDEAKRAAPALPQSPEHVIYDDAFIDAAFVE